MFDENCKMGNKSSGLDNLNVRLLRLAVPVAFHCHIFVISLFIHMYIISSICMETGKSYPNFQGLGPERCKQL